MKVGSAMTVANNTGLLWGFEWIVNGSFVEILLMFWLISPGIHMLVGLVGESRLVPLGEGQFDSFFPGDLLLGTAGACFWWIIANHLGQEHHWFHSYKLHLLVLIVLFIIGIVQMVLEYKAGTYAHRAVLSPTKIWHNVALYVLLGYPVAVGFVAQFSASWNGNHAKFFVFGSACFVIWVILMLKDTISGDDAAAAGAHIANWQPIWVTLREHGFTWSQFW